MIDHIGRLCKAAFAMILKPKENKHSKHRVLSIKRSSNLQNLLRAINTGGAANRLDSDEEWSPSPSSNRDRAKGVAKQAHTGSLIPEHFLGVPDEPLRETLGSERVAFGVNEEEQPWVNVVELMFSQSNHNPFQCSIMQT